MSNPEDTLIINSDQGAVLIDSYVVESWFQFYDENNQEIVRFTGDGRVELGEAYIARLDDAARAFWKAVYRANPDHFGKIGEK